MLDQFWNHKFFLGTDKDQDIFFESKTTLFQYSI